MSIFAALNKSKEKTDVCSLDEFMDFHYARLKSKHPMFERDPELKAALASDLEGYMYFCDSTSSKKEKIISDRNALVRCFEMFSTHAGFKHTYFNQDSRPNFFDLVSSTLDADTIIRMLFKLTAGKFNRGGDDQRAGLYSNIRMASDLVRFRDKVFDKMTHPKTVLDAKTNSRVKEVDLTPLKHNLFNNYEGLMAYYATTLNDPNYTIDKVADKVFNEYKDNYKDVRQVCQLFSGLSLLESKWAKHFEDARVWIYDSSQAALGLYYMLSDNPYYKHEQKFLDMEKFLYGLKEGSLVIRHNCLQNQDADEVLKEMELLGKFPHVKMFYSFFSVDDPVREGHYGSSTDHFAKYVKNEILLCDSDDMVTYDDKLPTPQGYVHNIGHKANKDIIVPNQYMTATAKLEKDTRAPFFFSHRYTDSFTRKMQDLSRAEWVHDSGYNFFLRF